MKIYSDKEEGPLKGVSNPSALSNDTYWSNSTFSIELDEDLLQVGCLIHNLKGREVGRVLAVIEHTGSFIH